MTRLPKLVLLLPLASLAGCAGQLRDYVGPRASIVRPQLIRYGFSLPEITCVGDRLGQTLRPRQLRFLVRATSNVERPYYDPDRFSPRDFLWAAGGLRDPDVQTAIRRAYEECRVQAAPRIAEAPPVPAPPATGGPLPATPRPPVWLNLGAAPSGQSIAVDGASLEQEESARVAWFRMIDPPPAGTSLHAYRLRIDCRTRIIRPLAHRLYDSTGAVVEERDYSEPEQLPSPVEGGTVTEIAFLSLCT
ncbi:MAG TPA: hypothetical protein VEC11_09300 [Allosphingosinicella sp.]|nr:hypothetical protein [Allosphingosinicella sp.]